MKQRLHYIDLIRGFAMMLVVFGHTSAHYAPKGSDSIGIAITSFWMSLFIFISGYINAVVMDDRHMNYTRYLNKKATLLLIPFISWTLIVPYMCGNYEILSVKGILSALCFFPNKGYWFLPVLFLIFLIYCLKHYIVELFHFNLKKDVALSTLLIVIILIGGKQYFLMIYAIYLFSFFFGEYTWRSKRLNEFVMNQWLYGLCAIILLIVWQFFPIINTEHSMKVAFLNLLMDLICSVAACIVFLNFFIKTSLPSFIDRGLTAVGRDSIMIYVIGILLIPRDFILPETWTMTAVNLVLLAIAVLNTIFRYAIGKTIEQIPILRYILLGKK